MAATLTVMGVALGMVALLAVPVDVHLSGARQPALRWQVKVRWLSGLVRLSRTGPPGASGPRPATRSGQPPHERRPEKPRIKRNRGRSVARRIRAALQSPGFPGRAVRLGVDLAATLRVPSLHGWARIGLEEPADTGLLWAFLGPVSASLALLPNVSLDLEPEFTEPVVRLQGSADLRLIPLQLFWTALAFLVAPVTLRAGWRAMRA